MARSPRTTPPKSPVRNARGATPPGNTAPTRGAPVARRAHRRTARLAPWLVGGFAALALAAVGALALISNLSKLQDLDADFARRVSLSYTYDDGSTMQVEGDRPGPLIDVATLPRHVVDAVLAAEDHEFYSHSGYRAASIYTAVRDNLRAGGPARGGSTITQQLVKNTYGHSEKTIFRKIREVVIASQAEGYFRRRFGKKGGKDRILALYVSRIELGFANGRPVLGLEDAARRYYGVPASRLTVGQSALIAGMLLNWGQLNPFRNYPVAARRRDLVLNRMLRFGFIDRARHDRAIAEDDSPLDQGDRSFLYPLATIRPAIVRLAHARAAQDQKEDLRIATTIDPAAQHLAASIVVKRLAGYRYANAAIVAIAGDGAVKVMIGGRDYGATQFNAAERGRLSLGSLLKPFVYLTALEQGAEPLDRCVDLPLPRESGWSPPNPYDGAGPKTLVAALMRSSNRVPVRLAAEVGRGATLRTLATMGFPAQRIPAGKTWVLTSTGSPLEIARAYLPLANGGLRVAPRLYDRVTTQSGATVETNRSATAPVAISPGSLAALRVMMRQVVTDGTGRAAGKDLPFAIAGKTGTTDDNIAAWFAGYGRGFVIVVWVGWNGPGRGPAALAGGHLPAQIANDFLRRARADWIRGLDLSPPPDAPSGRFFTTGRARAGYGCGEGEKLAVSPPPIRLRERNDSPTHFALRNDGKYPRLFGMHAQPSGAQDQ